MAHKTSSKIKLYNISKLTTKPAYWKIKATVKVETDTEEKKTWRNKNGEGRRFAVLFSDESSQIRGVTFDDKIARDLESEIENNKEYYVSGSRADLRIANKEYRRCHKYELKFKQKPIIEPVDGTCTSQSQGSSISDAGSASSSGNWSTESDKARSVQFDPIPLEEVLGKPKPSNPFDTLGVVKKPSGAEFQYDQNTRFYVKNMCIIDQTGEVDLRITGKCLKDLDILKGLRGKVIGVIGCCWKKYNKAILTAHVKKLYTESDMPECSELKVKELKKWYEETQKKSSKTPKGTKQILPEGRGMKRSYEEEEDGDIPKVPSTKQILFEDRGMKRSYEEEEDGDIPKVPTASAEFSKKSDDSLRVRDLENFFANGWQGSVCYLKCDMSGTAFRVGKEYLMTANHIIEGTIARIKNTIIEKAQSDPNRVDNYLKLLEFLEVESFGTDIEINIQNGINNWMKKSAHSLKFSTLLEALGTTGFSFARDEAFKSLQKSFISVAFGNDSAQDIPKYYPVKYDIPFYSVTDDIAILEVNWTQLPPQFPLARLGNPKYVHIVGYPCSHGGEQIFDPKCPLITEEAMPTYSEAVHWWKEAFPQVDVNRLEGTYKSAFFMPGKVKLNCSSSTTHGASGSPGVVLLDNDDPKVYLMLQEGFPEFVYDDQFKNQIETLSVPNRYLIESGISMSQVYNLLSKAGLVNLRNKLFHT